MGEELDRIMSFSTSRKPDWWETELGQEKGLASCLEIGHSF